MSHNDEKMLILKMLQEGKITSEEAAKLLETLEGGNASASANSNTRQAKQQNFQEELNRMKNRVESWKKEFKNNYNQKDFDNAVEELASKAEALGKNVAVTTFGLVDKVVDFVGSFVDTNAFNVFGSYKVVDKTFEAMAVEGMDLWIEGVNSQIIVKKHLDNKILIKTRVRSPQDNVDDILRFEETGNAVSLKVNKIGNVSVSHEIFLPAVHFGNVHFETSNSRIYAEDSQSQSFTCVTRNGNIELMGVNSSKLEVTTKNAKIQLSYIIGKDINIHTTSSVIDIKHIKAETLQAVTLNGRILVENVQNLNDAAILDIILKSTNGGIKVNMNDMENRGYKVRARTTNGSINVLVPEMVYHNVNKQGVGGSFVEAESSGYEGYAHKVSIQAETTNGPIEIIK